MKAKDVAKILMKNPEAEVIVSSGNFELNNSLVPVNYINTVKGKIVSRTFRDTFDNESYNTNVFDWDDKSETIFIKIN